MMLYDEQPGRLLEKSTDLWDNQDYFSLLSCFFNMNFHELVMN